MLRPRTRPHLVRPFLPAFALAVTVLAVALVMTSQGAAASGGATVNIEIGDNFFNPKAATVNVGDTIVWTNKGRNPHDVTASNGAFASPRMLAPGATFSYTATAAGTIAYQCTIHVNHDGTLTIQAAPAATGGAPGAVPRTGGGGGGLAIQPWQQLAAFGLLLAAGGGLLAIRRLRRAA